MLSAKVKKGKSRSQASVMTVPVPEQEPLPMDELIVKIQSLRITDDITMYFKIDVTFCDQLILCNVIKSTQARAVVKEKTVMEGRMLYDPSDYERMNLIPDNPLCVQIQPVKNIESNIYMIQSLDKIFEDMSCCNIDILPLFTEKTKISVKKRMQPLIKPSVLFLKSWDNLPLLSIKVEVKRDERNKRHHKIFKDANFIRLTLVGAYNMPVPFNEDYLYIAACKMPTQHVNDFSTVTFNRGRRVPKHFDSLKFYPKWESLRIGEGKFSSGEDKIVCNLDEIQNDEEIPLKYFLDDKTYSTIWGSCHRTLMLPDADQWLWKHIRTYHWPLEVHVYGEMMGFSFMAFLNLFKLLYAGGVWYALHVLCYIDDLPTAKEIYHLVKTTLNELEFSEDTVRIAVPLQWINAESMLLMCGCELMLTPNDRATTAPTSARSKTRPVHLNNVETNVNVVTYLYDSPGTPCSTNEDGTPCIPVTGSNDENAFVLVEVKLARPLRKVTIPPLIPKPEIFSMLNKMEESKPQKRECTGRGQLDRDWQFTVKNAATALRKVPYYGMIEFCNFNRQLSETRIRVELMTSCWQDAAVYINNNFVVQDFLKTDETFEEMLMMAHACLVRSACVTLVGGERKHDLDPTLKAARNSRQMQDISHATELYLQLVAENPRNANYWRELSTCLKDVDRDWANVCLNKSVALDPRHPLTLLSKGCMLFEEDPELAEPFFDAILVLFPYWTTGWIVANAYYNQRELFHMADKIMELFLSTVKENKLESYESPRLWEQELGDWWDPSLLLPGISQFYGAADCLLRLRAIELAEVCIALALCESGESATYYHLVALCSRLRGNVENALCHLRAGIDKYGEISYLRSLEAECCHKLNDIEGAKVAFEKAGTIAGSYSIILSTPCRRDQQRVRTILIDLCRRQPSAYSWMALANNWLTRALAIESSDELENTDLTPASARNYGVLCIIQALKLDRRAANAWALLATLVQPSARRLHCIQMAEFCGHKATSKENIETAVESKQSLCYLLGKTLQECRCEMCEMTTI